MPDPARLAAGLAAYATALERRQQTIVDALATLEGSYRALSEVYAGQGAGEFAAVWARAEETARAYADQSPALVLWLEEKAAQLRRLDEGL